LLLYDLDFATAGAEFKRAIELNPNGVEGHQGLGDYYASMGQVQESVQEMQHARELDPLAVIVNDDLCKMLFFARQYDEALAQCKANLDLAPNSVGPLLNVGDVYAAKGMDSEAVSALLHALPLMGASPTMIAAVKTGASGSGLKGFWRAMIQFMPENVTNGVDPVGVAMVYAHDGNSDKALLWLERATQTRSYGINYLGVNPVFDELRSDPRFVSLLKRIGLPQSQTRN